MNYSLAYSYYNEEGAMVYSGSKKHNISFNMNHEINKWLTVNSRISYDQMRVEGMGTSEGGDRFNKMQHILQYRPTVGIMGVDEDLLYGEDPLLADDNGNVMQNPLISAAEELNDREWRTFQANGGATIKLLKGLSFRSTVGMRYQTRRNDVFYGDESITGKRSSIQGSITNLENSSFQTSNVLTYSWKNKIHDFTVIAGHEYVERWSRSFSASASQFPNDEIGLGDLSLGVPGVPTSSENYDDKLLSFFGRINYNLMDKYLFTASVRADGSSKFAKKNRYGLFPSASLAWNFSEEDFMKDYKKWFSSGKIRLSWGLTGNNRIGEYDYLALLDMIKSHATTSMTNTVYPFDGNNGNVGVAPISLPNEDLKWETTEQWNLGLDLGFFDERISFTADLYRKTTRDLLLDATLPYSSGYLTAMKNIGKVRNDGIELTLNTVNIDSKNFKWSSNFNISFNKNKVLELAENQTSLLSTARFDQNFNSQPNYVAKIGQPMGMIYGYIYEGTYKYDDFDKSGSSYTLKGNIPHYVSESNTQPGMPKYKDLNGDGIIDTNDRTMIGRGLPIHTGGFTNNFEYKGFDLSVFFQWSYGNDVLNANRLFFDSGFQKKRELNQYASYTDRWTPENPNSNIPAATNSSSNLVISSRVVEDASFLRLKTVTLGYTVPKTFLKKYKIDNARLYVAAQNLWTITGYSGYDPEVSIRSGGLTPGLDFSSYPRALSVSFGINLGF